MVFYSYMTSKMLNNELNEFKSEIMTLMDRIPMMEEGTVIQYGFVVGGDNFFSIDVVYEAIDSVVLSGIERISSDTFLDFINYNQAIGYGI